MVTTNDPALADRLRKLRQHAMSVSDVVRHKSNKVINETYDEVGYNFRMTDMQAAVGLVQLGKLPAFLRRRRQLAARYSEGFRRAEQLRVPFVPENCAHNYQSYMLRLVSRTAEERDAIMQVLLEKGISTRRGIMAIHRERPYQSARWDKSLVNTAWASDSCLILPLFHQMTEAEQDYVIESVLQAVS